MNENLYNFYVSKLITYSKTSPVYQYPVLVFLYQGISWDIEKYKKNKLYSILEINNSRKEKRIYVKAGRKKVIINTKNPYLRNFNYFSSLSPLIYFFPELIPDITQS